MRKSPEQEPINQNGNPTVQTALEKIEKACRESQLGPFRESTEEEGFYGVHIFQVGNEVWSIDNYNPRSVTICRVNLPEGKALKDLIFGEGKRWADVIADEGDLGKENVMNELRRWAGRNGRNWEWGLVQVSGRETTETTAISYLNGQIETPIRDNSEAAAKLNDLFTRASSAIRGEVSPLIPAKIAA